MRTLIITILTTLLLSPCALAQNERPMVRKGNDLFDKEKYMESEVAYRKALEKKTESFEAQYNLAGSLYKQEKFKEAAEQYQVAANGTKDSKELGAVYHNLGNSFMADKQLEKGIDAYKESLRNDAEGEISDKTRYNLAYAQKLLQQQKEQQKKDQDKKDDKEKKEDKEKQDQDKGDQKDDKDQQKKDQEEKDKKDQQKQDQDKKDQEKEEQQQQQSTPQEISKQNAEQILNALKQDEKEIREKVEIQKAKAAQRKKVEKDW